MFRLQKNTLFILLLLGMAFTVHGQEICDNGIDDDFDNRIDCFDPDCSGNARCDSFFYGAVVPSCQYLPAVGQFGAGSQWESALDVDHTATPIVADVDGDGVPEVFVSGKIPPLGLSDTKIRMLSGIDGTLIANLDLVNACTGIPIVVRRHGSNIAVGDIDKDGFGEIIAMAEDRILYCFEHDGTLKWYSNDGSAGACPTAVPVGYGPSTYFPPPSIADFNQDGAPEVFAGNEVFSGSTGILMAQAGVTASRGRPSTAEYAVPAAVDVIPTGAGIGNTQGLELVCGNQVWSVDVIAGTMTLETALGTPWFDGFTSIADMDYDGDLDGVIAMYTGFGSAARIYIWDLQTPTIMGISPTLAGNSGNGAVGQPTIGDFDGDKRLEIGVASRNAYTVFDDLVVSASPLATLWNRTTVDGSATTGSSLFDFDGDGQVEVVYRDESSLFIYNGPNGNILETFPCISGSAIEHPVIADVNGDDQTEIVCSCAPFVGSRVGTIKSFRSSRRPWVVSRKLWNQHSYFVVNVNDDLTIPRVQQDDYLMPPPSPMEALNSFLVQSTSLTIDGEPAFPATDASITLDTVDFSLCQDGVNNSLTLGFTVTNVSPNLKLPFGNSVTAYNGNPFVNAGAIPIDTVVIPINLNTSESFSFSLTIPDQGGSFDLYVVANDDGGGIFPMFRPNTSVGECDYTNNIDSMLVDNCNIAPLAVDLVYFNGVMDNNVTFLNWATATENNNEGFIVERSYDNSAFEEVGFVKGAGFKSSESKYNFNDPIVNPKSNNLYYRLRQIDFDGAFEYSNTVLIRLDDASQAGIIKAYPNPAQNQIFIDYLVGKNSQVSVSLMNTLGQEVMPAQSFGTNTPGVHSGALDLHSIKNGVYILALKAGTQTYTQKIIILH